MMNGNKAGKRGVRQSKRNITGRQGSENVEIQVEIQDNAELFKREFEEKLKTALEAVGLQAEGNAKLEIENMPRRVDTGLLRNSITHTVKERAVIVGTNLIYAV